MASVTIVASVLISKTGLGFVWEKKSHDHEVGRSKGAGNDKYQCPTKGLSDIQPRQGYWYRDYRPYPRESDRVRQEHFPYLYARVAGEVDG